MEFDKALKYLSQYAECPKCHSRYLGEAHGEMKLEGDKFIRTCRCGFKIVIDENGNVLEEGNNTY